MIDLTRKYTQQESSRKRKEIAKLNKEYKDKFPRFSLRNRLFPEDRDRGI